MTSYLCNCIGVSKSGYYNYLKNENKRIERDNKDQKDFDLILKAYKFKKSHDNVAKLYFNYLNSIKSLRNQLFNIKL